MNKHYTVVLVAMLLALGVAVAAVAAQPGARRCFPASSWDAAQGKRPCIEVLRVEEDGSFRFRASDADGTERYTAGVGALDR